MNPNYNLGNTYFNLSFLDYEKFVTDNLDNKFEDYFLNSDPNDDNANKFKKHSYYNLINIILDLVNLFNQENYTNFPLEVSVAELYKKFTDEHVIFLNNKYQKTMDYPQINRNYKQFYLINETIKLLQTAFPKLIIPLNSIT